MRTTAWAFLPFWTPRWRSYAGRMRYVGYQAEHDAVRAETGAIAGELLRAYEALRSLRNLSVPSAGLAGIVAQAAAREVLGRLAEALGSVLGQTQAVTMTIENAIAAYAALDEQAAADLGRVRRP